MVSRLLVVNKSKAGNKCTWASKSFGAWELSNSLDDDAEIKGRHGASRSRATSRRAEVDEIYIGGQEVEGEKYRSSKRLILIAVEKNGSSIGRIRMKLIPNTKSKTLNCAIQELVKAGSVIQTDGWIGYFSIKDNGFKHQVLEMPKNRKEKRDQNVLPNVHRVASLFKRWLLETYQGRVDAKHLPAYLDEFVFRFNRRTSKSRGLLFRRLLENCVKVIPQTYQSLVNTKIN